MQELEIVREKIQSKYRVVKTDEDLEWNRAIDLCTNIINAHLSCENAAETARSSRDNGSWIPVKKQLPEKERKSYLVTYEARNGRRYVKEAYLEYVGESPRVAYWTKKHRGCVIAWRPLPEPYHAERSRE